MTRTPQGTAGRGAPAPRPEPVPLPVTAVTCMEDRAQVERRGSVELAAGAQRLLVGPVTPLAVDRSLRAEVPAGEGGAGGVRVVDARVVRTYAPPRPGHLGDDASELRRRVRDLEEELRDARWLRQRLESRLAVVAQARADLYRDVAEGAGAGSADPERWADRMERIDEEDEARSGELRLLRRRLLGAEEELEDARRALRRTEEEPQELTAVVEVVVEADRAGPAVLRLTHLVPCALWRPAYRATLAGDERSVRLETDAVVWQRTGEDWKGVRLSLSTARPTLAAGPPALHEDELVLRERSAAERRTVEVDLREEEVRTVGDGPNGDGQAGPAGADAELPGLSDGGEVRVMTAAAPVDVACDGRPHRVPLSALTAPCRTGLECAPELSPLVTRVARAANGAGHVLLAGPVDLVRGGGFTGRGELPFTGQGEEVSLAFGSEDTYRVVRHVGESRGTAGLSGVNHRTVITRTVRLFVSRLDSSPRGEAAVVVVRERVPVSEVSAVEVRLRKEACLPEPDEGVDAEGMVRYTLRLAPGERREITLEYELTAADGVVGL
ncbi:mucoidy inhibitor MuiA family protein [Streptomyces chitinivorans]|uniref:Mucoidy inhibitor MuiA family protein n=1 Tax=Streptomyces chitinivorans TaxID=1257027 RepID=A0ABW7HTU6_9ACTN|nr:mucoidy inhibitor MuiA family protein [Streptomyces chitinivorans]MDH2411498.1 mucoidy inhibitor MuiA family protein [Streptomyces chitinivorans]